MSSPTNFYFSICTDIPARISIRNVKFPEKIFDIESDDMAFKSVGDAVAEARRAQSQRLSDNVQSVIAALTKMKAEIEGKYDDIAFVLEQRIASIKDGQDGAPGIDGRPGRDGKDGRPGRDGKDGKDFSDSSDSLVDLLDSSSKGFSYLYLSGFFHSSSIVFFNSSPSSDNSNSKYSLSKSIFSALILFLYKSIM